MRDSFDRMLYRLHVKRCYEKMHRIFAAQGLHLIIE